MNAIATPRATASLTDLVDQLGKMRAKISKIQEEETRLTEAIKAAGPGRFRGRRYVASVTIDGERSVLRLRRRG